MEMVDMRRTPEESDKNTEGLGPQSSPNAYPYGLCICLTHEELEKLDLDSTCEVGDMVHLHALAKVTSFSKRETDVGEDCRVELQIMFMSVEDENDENEAPSPRYRLRPGRLYKD